MSLLWTQAAWYHDKPGGEDWDRYGYGHETRQERAERYLRQIQAAHRVGRPEALRAAKAIQSGGLDPVGAGFASQPPFSEETWRRLPSQSLVDDTWHRPPVDVSLKHPIHATQCWLKDDQMWHNLFHPGKKPPLYSEDTGHPDVDPNDHRDDDDDRHWDANHGDAPAMIRQTDGSHVLLDGHHRVATDLLLGKPTTRARLIDIRELGGRFPASRRGTWLAARTTR